MNNSLVGTNNSLIGTNKLYCLVLSCNTGYAALYTHFNTVYITFLHVLIFVVFCRLKLHQKCYKNGPPLSGCQFVRTTISMTRSKPKLFLGYLMHVFSEGERKVRFDVPFLVFRRFHCGNHSLLVSTYTIRLFTANLREAFLW